MKIITRLGRCKQNVDLTIIIEKPLARCGKTIMNRCLSWKGTCIMKKNPKYTIKLVFPWLVLGAILIILYVSGELIDIARALVIIKPQFLGLSLLLIIAYWISEASILMLLLNRAISFKRALSITLAGQFFNGITPFA